MSIAYLACPYSHSDPKIRELRLALVTQTAYELMRQGIHVYSPLTHNIPIGRFGIQADWMTWREFDHGMLLRCDRLIVLMLPGWEDSKGVSAEIACAKENGLPIEMMEYSKESYQRYLDISLSPFKDFLTRLLAFYAERDWSQFHAPKNLAMNLGVEVGELMEHFRWLNESQSYIESPQKLSEIKDEIGDVCIVLLHLAHTLGINPLEAAEEKLTKIGKKYPVEKCKGLSHRYTAYETVNHD